MRKKINAKIKLLWGEIREHLHYKRNNRPNNFWFDMHRELFEQKCFAIKVLKEIRNE